MKICSDAEAKRIIVDLIDAGHDGALVGSQDGGVNVDIPFSRIPGRESEVMGLRESERRMDAAIRAAWSKLVGSKIKGDPVEFISS